MRIVDQLVLIAICLVVLTTAVHGSIGDRCSFFQKCYRYCFKFNCAGNNLTSFYGNQPTHLKLLYWTCEDECKYECMWKTVRQFTIHGEPCPQFYGKWPFIRVLGVQEPASVLFSLLNGASFVLALRYMRSELTGEEPMYVVWVVQQLLGINAWTWSVIFHSRDTPFTEMMDYAGALSLVLYALMALVIRLISSYTVNADASSNTLRYQLIAATVVAFTSFYTYHLHYLMFVKFDYGYNMTVNITSGIINLLAWIVWCLHQYWRHGHTYQWRCLLVVTLTGLFCALEVADFPPILWTFDAHSLWHLATIPLPVLWSGFIIHDCKRLLEQSKGVAIDPH